jgi:putative phosphoesterase
MKIGLLSDTHGYLDPKVLYHFKECDEIWHAGDVGNIEICDQLKTFCNIRVVYGNIDGNVIRSSYPAEQNFICEGLKVFITHIGGYPGNYSPGIAARIESEKPGLFICGHSHILKVITDKKYNLLHMNPGAAGKYGFHKFRTILRFDVESGIVKNLEAIELGLRSSLD